MAAAEKTPMGAQRLKVDVSRERYPFCIVWTPIPVLTFLLPFVGHTGVADSQGVIYDFAGPYTISVDNLSFGRTTRYIQVFSLEDAADLAKVQAWDEAVKEASEVYSGRMHNLFCDNCHSHVAFALNLLSLKGRRNWNMVVLAAWIFFFGNFVSFGRALYSVLPSLLLYGIIIFFCA